MGEPNLTSEEMVALGRVCGCGDCEYCEEVWLVAAAEKIGMAIKAEYCEAIKEYKRQWLKSK